MGRGYLPTGASGGVVAAIPLVASCYQFCRSDAKTEDHFFLGFPSYWNVVAFYVVVLDLGVAVTTGMLLVLSVLSFVPGQVRLPLAHRALVDAEHGLAMVWLASYAVITATLPDPAGPGCGLVCRWPTWRTTWA